MPRSYIKKIRINPQNPCHPCSIFSTNRTARCPDHTLKNPHKSVKSVKSVSSVFHFFYEPYNTMSPRIQFFSLLFIRLFSTLENLQQQLPELFTFLFRVAFI